MLFYGGDGISLRNGKEGGKTYVDTPEFFLRVESDDFF